METSEFDIILTWLQLERETYQTKKFDYEEEKEKNVDYWMQQFNSYLQRIPLFGIDTMQGQQAILKLAATAIACAEHIAERIDDIPEPGHSSGDIKSWRHQ
jgi:hypothetical protein